MDPAEDDASLHQPHAHLRHRLVMRRLAVLQLPVVVRHEQAPLHVGIACMHVEVRTATGKCAVSVLRSPYGIPPHRL